MQKTKIAVCLKNVLSYRKVKNSILTVALTLTVATSLIAQTCWQEVSQIPDRYLRIVKYDDNLFFAAACNTTGIGPESTNKMYYSNDLDSWFPLETALSSSGYAFNIDNNQRLLLTTRHEGIYSSIDQGNSWIYANVGNGFGCMALDIEKDSFNTLYAGLDGFLRGLYVSNDNGLTWLNKLEGRAIMDIEVINNLNQVYTINRFNSEIYVSNDNGNTWEQILGQPFSNSSVFIKHINSNIYIFTNAGEIYVSINAGQSWNLHSQIPITGTATPYHNDAVFVGDTTWWVGIHQNGLWRSNDNGLTWSQEDSCLTGDFHFLFLEGSTLLATTSTGVFKYENVPGCSINTTITSSSSYLTTGNTATFNASTSDSNPTYIWQSDFGQGFQTLNDFGNYSGTNTANLSIADVQLSQHYQPIRVITTSGECVDTSAVVVISITDTCINWIIDTTYTTVTDTLIINTLITALAPPANTNTIKVFPNPAGSILTIDYGNFALMNGYQLRIENSLGQEVFQTNINQQSDTLNLATWGGNGLYFVHIVDPQGNTIDIRKIVLQ